MLAFRLHKQTYSSQSAPVIKWPRLKVPSPCWAALALTSVISFHVCEQTHRQRQIAYKQSKSQESTHGIKGYTYPSRAKHCTT
jgi:hypothetical protein